MGAADRLWYRGLTKRLRRRSGERRSGAASFKDDSTAVISAHEDSAFRTIWIPLKYKDAPLNWLVIHHTHCRRYTLTTIGVIGGTGPGRRAYRSSPSKGSDPAGTTCSLQSIPYCSGCRTSPTNCDDSIHGSGPGKIRGSWSSMKPSNL